MYTPLCTDHDLILALNTSSGPFSHLEKAILTSIYLWRDCEDSLWTSWRAAFVGLEPQTYLTALAELERRGVVTRHHGAQDGLGLALDTSRLTEILATEASPWGM